MEAFQGLGFGAGGDEVALVGAELVVGRFFPRVIVRCSGRCGGAGACGPGRGRGTRRQRWGWR